MRTQVVICLTAALALLLSGPVSAPASSPSPAIVPSAVSPALFIAQSAASSREDDGRTAKLLAASFEADYNMDVKVARGDASYISKGHLVFSKGRFMITSGTYTILYDGSSLCTLDSSSKEAVIEASDGLESLILSLAGTKADIVPAFGDDGRLKSLRLTTEKGTAISVAIPSFSYLGTEPEPGLFSIDIDSLESQDYVVTDLR